MRWTSNTIGVDLLRFLHNQRISPPGKGRSARERLLDAVFHSGLESSMVQEIAEEVAILCEQVMEDDDVL